MKNLKLVEYDSSYAKAVATMWQNSSKGWNGNWANETEDSVLKAHAHCADINTYLAVKDDEVVGYCGFSKYENDDDTLYIRLLNVRYDMHGMGVGKMLVKKSIERTIDLKWPRIDLYTWQGNTKSLPLYKKCGFFFEKRDDETHLMNFIPGIINSEVFKKFFTKVDWYKDLKRTIDLNPDGIEENGFTFYEYLWEKNGEFLKVGIERKSRGIAYIENNNYSIKSSMEGENVIFNEKAAVKYEIRNKTNKPLNIQIKGKNDKNVRYSLEDKYEVLDYETISGEFWQEESNEKVGSLATYPAVVTEMYINGKKITFKLSVDGKYPVDIKLNVPENKGQLNSKSYVYVDLQNNYNEEVTFEFQLKNNKSINFLDNEIKVLMNKNEKKSFKLAYVLSKGAFYSENINIKAIFKSGREFIFKKFIVGNFKAIEGCFGGAMEDCYIIANGQYSIKFNDENYIFFQSFRKNTNRFEISYPILGKPFSQEFSNKKPNRIEHYIEENKIVLKISFLSETFKEIELNYFIKLSSDGITEYYYEILNCGNEEKDIIVCQNIFMKLDGVVMPLNNKYVRGIDLSAVWLEDFNVEELTENWIFTKDNNETLSMWWDPNLKIKSNGWQLVFESNFKKLKPAEKVSTKPLFVALNTFENWRELKDVASKESKINKGELIDSVEFVINDGNPFVYDNFKTKIVQHGAIGLDGNYYVTINDNRLMKSCKKEEEIFNIDFDIDASENNREILMLEADSKRYMLEQKKMFFKIGNEKCVSKIVEDNGLKSHSVSNGLMEIRACGDFAHVLYSLKYNNHQWLESSFPSAKPKSWFNPWFGGIGTLPEILTNMSVLEEKINLEFVNKKDNFNNLWEGIKVKINIEKNEKFKGLEINQYYLMLPKVPILCHTIEVISSMGKFMNLERFENFSFFNLDEKNSNNWVKLKDSNHSFIKYKAGGEGMNIVEDESILYGTNSLKDKIQFYTKGSDSVSTIFINMTDTAFVNERDITLESGRSKFTSPDFYIFTKEYIEDQLLKDLKNINFK